MNGIILNLKLNLRMEFACQNPFGAFNADSPVFQRYLGAI